MSEMVERVALAIYPMLGRAADFHGNGVEPWDELAPDSWLREAATEAARDAIEAMREPDDRMRETAWRVVPAHELADGDDMVEAYQSMIDAALTSRLDGDGK